MDFRKHPCPYSMYQELQHLTIKNCFGWEMEIKGEGTIWTAIAHVITGVIGSGVLSLAWSMAQLGWIAGPVLMLLYPDPDYGHVRNRTYSEAVRLYLGNKHAWACGLMMHIGFYGAGVAYVITSALCMRAIQRSNCFHKHGHDNHCEFSHMSYMLLFGLIQIVISQIPDFHSMEWLSVVAAIMSFTYSTIGLGLGTAKVIGSAVIKGTIFGVSTTTRTGKMWRVSQAIGDIAFAYPFTVIVLNIQDTLRSPPSERVTMKKASMISVGITTFFYLTVGGFGYAAFGDQTPGNILTGFGFFEPYWLVDFANACIVLHLLGGYQVYSQPVFALVEKWFAEKFPTNALVNSQYIMKFPLFPVLDLNVGRLCFRTAYVASTTIIAIMFPYFNQMLGVLGAFSFWPTAVYFPVEMCLRRESIGAWTIKWILLRSFSVVCCIMTMFALIGSVEGLITAKYS